MTSQCLQLFSLFTRDKPAIERLQAAYTAGKFSGLVRFLGMKYRIEITPIHE